MTKVIMAITQRFLLRKFRLQSSDNHTEFFVSQGFSRCHCAFRNGLSNFRGGFIYIEPIHYGHAYVIRARIHGKDRDIQFRPGQRVGGIGFNGKPVEISFTMEGDYLKEVHIPIGNPRADHRFDCVYYDVAKNTLVAKAYHYSLDPNQKPITWTRTYCSADPVLDLPPYRDHFDEM